MSDLISRSELIKVLKDRATNEAIMGYMTAYDVTNSIIDEVEEQPTVYDIDKIVKELKKNASRYTKKYTTPYGNNGYRDVKAISIRKAIEIVKQGSVSNDVCELRLLKGYKFLHETSCGYVFDMQNGFKYCPYCGKKVKVMG